MTTTYRGNHTDDRLTLVSVTVEWSQHLESLNNSRAGWKARWTDWTSCTGCTNGWALPG